jgi:alkanesulfonate monooxygenase SsuD/methylene tetrahydromethanopterin reductase-like flavin-dependent oxidoreductase (luciferase family)
MVFRSFVFTEMPYPHLPPVDLVPSNRIDLPNSYYDPDAGYQLYKGYYDLYPAADELGLDIMLNEHHSTATCTNAVTPLSMAIVARETKRARILTLGNPVAHRSDPVRVAEEMATVDVISRGRTEIGFVRGVPQETIAVNSSPIDMKQRMWEAIDLILQAWTTRDGPFSWEGEYFHHRQVNIWPRPYQQPHPPLWMPTTTPSSAGVVARRGMTVATLGVGIEASATIFDAYRREVEELGQPAAPLEHFAYSPFVFVGDTDEQALQEARKLQSWFTEAIRHPFQYTDVPGYTDATTRARFLKARTNGIDAFDMAPPGFRSLRAISRADVEDLVHAGYILAGNADSVFEQLRTVFDGTGGFGNMLMMVQYGTMSTDVVISGLERYATEVLPRFVDEVSMPTVRGDRAIERISAP